ncbi:MULTISPECIES: amidase [Gammaproteobacteria]|uniref:Amidase n=1 Tax=Xanthomonas boreopolis TaxID=86183 RepID=A0A919FCD0_9XANT|nr:amidase family protein [Pseudomonas sp. Hp2]GHH60243.1 amidase [[Pseudomonas] boreopolis]
MQLRRGSATTLAALLSLACIAAPGRAQTAFDLETASIADINRAIDSGALTSERLVQLSLARIRAYDPHLHAIIGLNPHALEQARMLDAERRSQGRRSPLHGIPVLVKDNINTRDLPTTLGFYGLKGAIPKADATVVARLRKAGAIILAKANLSELASGPPLSSLGGQTRNPHDPAYSPAGSSNGTAVGVAAGYAPVGIATDTTGSARWPAATNGVVGLRPSTGALSYAGIQPNAPTLDTVGTMARSVADAALVFAVLEGTDGAGDGNGPTPTGTLPGLRADALRGARIGFPRRDFSGDDPAVDAVMGDALAQLEAAGATVVDVELPFWLPRLAGDLQSIIVRTESAPSLDAYLAASFPPGFPRSHAQILAMSEALNAAPPAGATPNPGRLDGYRDEARAPASTDAYYQAAVREGLQFVRASMRAVLVQNRLDAIVYPTQTMRINRIGEAPARNSRGLFGNHGPVLASLAGWPELTVPAGATPEGLPVGISFLGPASSESRLLGYGFAFEQKTHALRQPAQTPPLAGDRFTYAGPAQETTTQGSRASPQRP